jgi:thymidylate synthase
MNRLDEQYRGLLAEVLYNGTKKNDRTGTGTLSRFGMSIRHRMEDGFPILTTKKMPLNTISTELKWFLKGDTNIKYLVDNGCNIWNGDAYKRYCKLQVPHDHFETEDEFVELIKTNDKFAKKWGELGPIYGKQWRSWEGPSGENWDMTPIDQIQDLISDLKTNPDSRRLMVNAWNVGELDQMVLPPCHYAFQCYVADGKLSLMWQQRSADLFLGVPFNISSYGLLLLLLCDATGYEPGELIGNFGDIHLYKNHLEQAKEQINRSSFELPKLEVYNVDILNGEFNWSHTEYKCHPTIKAPLSN